MATPLVSASKFHQVIRELGRITTAGGIAALLLGLMFLAVVSVLLLVNNEMHKFILAGGGMLAMVFFGVFAVLVLRTPKGE